MMHGFIQLLTASKLVRLSVYGYLLLFLVVFVVMETTRQLACHWSAVKKALDVGRFFQKS